MELWFSERHTKGVKFSIKVDRQLFTGHSEFQRIDIFDASVFACIRKLEDMERRDRAKRWFEEE